MASWETWSQVDVRARLNRASIAVLMGGESEEREVSLTSGRAISSALFTSMKSVKERVKSPTLASGNALMKLV